MIWRNGSKYVNRFQQDMLVRYYFKRAVQWNTISLYFYFPTWNLLFTKILELDSKKHFIVHTCLYNCKVIPDEYGASGLGILVKVVVMSYK